MTGAGIVSIKIEQAKAAIGRLGAYKSKASNGGVYEQRYDKD